MCVWNGFARKSRDKKREISEAVSCVCEIKQCELKLTRFLCYCWYRSRPQPRSLPHCVCHSIIHRLENDVDDTFAVWSPTVPNVCSQSFHGPKMTEKLATLFAVNYHLVYPETSQQISADGIPRLDWALNANLLIQSNVHTQQNVYYFLLISEIAWYGFPNGFSSDTLHINRMNTDRKNAKSYLVRFLHRVNVGRIWLQTSGRVLEGERCLGLGGGKVGVS